MLCSGSIVAALGDDPSGLTKTVRSTGGVSDERAARYVDAAARYLRAPLTANGSIGVIGYCTGAAGLSSQRASSKFKLPSTATGEFVSRSTGPDDPIPRVSIAEHLGNLSCPLLGPLDGWKKMRDWFSLHLTV